MILFKKRFYFLSFFIFFSVGFFSTVLSKPTCIIADDQFRDFATSKNVIAAMHHIKQLFNDDMVFVSSDKTRIGKKYNYLFFFSDQATKRIDLINEPKDILSKRRNKVDHIVVIAVLDEIGFFDPIVSLSSINLGKKDFAIRLASMDGKYRNTENNKSAEVALAGYLNVNLKKKSIKEKKPKKQPKKPLKEIQKKQPKKPLKEKKPKKQPKKPLKEIQKKQPKKPLKEKKPKKQPGITHEKKKLISSTIKPGQTYFIEYDVPEWAEGEVDPILTSASNYMKNLLETDFGFSHKKMEKKYDFLFYFTSQGTERVFINNSEGQVQLKFRNQAKRVVVVLVRNEKFLTGNLFLSPSMLGLDDKKDFVFNFAFMDKQYQNVESNAKVLRGLKEYLERMSK